MEICSSSTDSRNDNKLPAVHNNQAVDDAFFTLEKTGMDKDVTVAVAPSETDVSEWEIVAFTNEEEVDVLLNHKFKGKTFNSNGKHEWMREYIKQLKVCIKWFQKGLEELVKEKDHLHTMLDSSERKRVETEAAMKLKEEEWNSTILTLENKISFLNERLANEESQKLDAIASHDQEKETRIALEKNLLLANQNSLTASQKLKQQEDLYKRSQEYNIKLQSELTCAKHSRSDAVNGKETAVKEANVLRGKLQQLKMEEYRAKTATDHERRSWSMKLLDSRRKISSLQLQLNTANRKVAVRRS